MRKSRAVLGSLGALAATVTLVATTAVPAGAVGPFTVKVGTKTTGSYSLSGTTTGTAPQIKLASGGVNMSCASGTAAGKVVAGVDPDGKGLATISSSTWTSCKGPLNLAMTVTQTGSWRLDALAPPKTTGVVAGQISSVKARVSAANPNQCSFDVAGTVKADFSQLPTTAQKLTISSPSSTVLTLSNVVGCFGLLTNGATATFTAVYAITSPTGAISITSP